jgi:hypothetical protein
MGILDWSNYACEVLGTVLTVVSWKQLSNPFRLIGLHIFCGTITDWVCYFFLMRCLHIGNIWLINIYIPIDVTLLLIAAMAMIERKLFKYSILVAVSIFDIVYLIHYSIYSDLLSDLHYVVGSIMVGICYFYLLFEKYQSKESSLFKTMIFWLCIIHILYYLVQIPSLAVSNSNITTLSFRRAMSNINGLLNIFMYPATGLVFFKIRSATLKKIPNKT